MNAEKPIRVLLAEDHMVVREGLKKLLESEADIEVVGESESGRQAIAMTLKLRPDVIIMDIAMPLLNGLEATRQILKSVPGARILILSAYGDDAYVEKMLALGAMGYLIKQTSAQFLARAVREIHKGKIPLSPSIAKKVQLRHTRSLGRDGISRMKGARLSGREMEVLQLVAEGKANKQVAAELGISAKTVEKHRDHLMRKLDIHDTASLTRYAIVSGVIECDVPLTIV